jgi:hypothetical protein
MAAVPISGTSDEYRRSIESDSSLLSKGYADGGRGVVCADRWLKVRGRCSGRKVNVFVVGD